MRGPLSWRCKRVGRWSVSGSVRSRRMLIWSPGAFWKQLTPERVRSQSQRTASLVRSDLVTDELRPEVPEIVRIGRFLELVTEMLERSDYLLPVAAGQRQFRQDNYNMASSALLEDLFFDALGMFVRENHPRVTLERRTGKELWDYGVDGLLLSHKESVSKTISVWWTAGDRPGDSKAYVPKPELQTFTADHPIVMVYSGCPAFDWTSASRSLATDQLAGDTAAPARTDRRIPGEPRDHWQSRGIRKQRTCACATSCVEPPGRRARLAARRMETPDLP